MDKKQENLYALGEVSKMTGIEKETLRKYTTEFNIQTQWTKPNNEGHRRYTKKNVETLIKIREKIQEQNWSWKQVNGWLNGEEDYFIDHVEKSNLEKKMDQLLEYQKSQDEFNKKLLETLEKERLERKRLEEFIDVKLLERDKNLVESMNKIQENKHQQKKSFFKRLLGGS